MKQNNIQFSTDRQSATEGEVINVSWDCGVPDSVALKVENGYRTYILQLADSGSRALMVEKSKGKMTLTLTRACGVHKDSKTIAVKVKNLKVVKARPARSHSTRSNGGRSIPSPSQLWQRIKEGTRAFIGRIKYAWQVMPPKTKRIYRIVLIVLAVLYISSIGQSRGYRAGYEQAIKDQQTIEQRYNHPAPGGFESPAPAQQQPDSPTNSI
ncbi:MAG: hypothetical protein E7134_04200 [Rikenellaceae bacterium]|nr:hypothetical protein [Rikenellaceae bacterium]